jgi:hypothetical protein
MESLPMRVDARSWCFLGLVSRKWARWDPGSLDPSRNNQIRGLKHQTFVYTWTI